MMGVFRRNPAGTLTRILGEIRHCLVVVLLFYKLVVLAPRTIEAANQEGIVIQQHRQSQHCRLRISALLRDRHWMLVASWHGSTTLSANLDWRDVEESIIPLHDWLIDWLTRPQEWRHFLWEPRISKRAFVSPYVRMMSFRGNLQLILPSRHHLQ
jgi:hypothetical protein